MREPNPNCTCVWVVMMGEEHRFFTPGCHVHVEGQSEARLGLPYEPTISSLVKRPARTPDERAERS